MNKSKAVIFPSVFLLTATLWGQGVLPGGGSPFGRPQSQAPAQPAPQPAPTMGTSGNYSSTTGEGMVDRLFDVNSDSVDMENGSIQWKGRTFNLGNSRLMRARLERYLAAPSPEEDLRRYEEILGRIDLLLSPRVVNQSNAKANFQEAWNLLFEAGQFEADAENCLTIASLVDKTIRMRSESQDLQIDLRQMDTLRRYQETIVNYRVGASSVGGGGSNSGGGSRNTGGGRNGGGNNNARGGGGRNTGASTGGISSEERLATEREAQARKELEKTEKNIVQTEAEVSMRGLKARLEFQSQIASFLLQRRFQHAIIANAFYRQIFSGSAHDMKVGQQQLKEMFPISDFVPTIDSVDMLAREAIKDVETGMQAVTQLYDSGDRYGAFERIQETFFLGEYDPQVMFFDYEKKQTLLEIWRNLRDLQRMGDERDLAGVEDAVNRVRALAEDFPAAQVMSRVNNAMQMSNLAVLSAKQAALVGDMPKAEAQIERATLLWPTNPAIKDFVQQVVNQADLLGQKVPEFDRLYQSRNYREIYNRKEEFAMALLQDKERADQLRQVMVAVGEIEARMVNAKVLHRQGNSYMAWDVLEEASRLGVSDPDLATARGALSAAVADYSKTLADAEKYEKAGNLSASLTEYLAAQDLNQASDFCRQAIHRVSRRLLEETMVRPVAVSQEQ